MNRDTVTGIAWAVGLVAVMAGVFVYEVVTFEMTTYDVTWSTMDDTVAMESGSLNAGQETSFEYMIDGTNLTSITAALSWTDDVGNNDQFTVTVTYADEEGDSVSFNANANNGAARVVVDLEAPEDGQVEGVNEADARMELEIPMPWEGERAVTVTVRLDQAPGTGGTAPPATSTPDGSNTFSLDVTAQRAMASLTEV